MPGTPTLRPLLLALLLALAPPGCAPDDGWTPLFDGRTFDGWEGNMDAFRIEDEALVGGAMTRPMPQNEFLCTTEEYGDFELRLQFKAVGEATNGGVQIRSTRIPGSHEVIGYQADLGDGYWGVLYDESRRNRVLTGTEDTALEVLDPDGWNDYTIRAGGPRLQLSINDHPTVDYTETEPGITRQGSICLQIHSGPPGEMHYKNLQLRPLP